MANILLNLGILGFFKYYNFFVANLATLMDSLGWKLDWVTLQIVLPVGISFYTFQALSYSIDVYNGKLSATHDFVEFFAYISFFPQLVAGPIERATNLLPQFQHPRRFDYGKAVDGMRQMLWGFFKKVVVADNCAVVVNEYWMHFEKLPGITLFLLGVLFAFQIYGDFSGYSDIAIGCARLFGFNLTRNFDFPYFSRSIPDFWRRWHISLTTWFRDYIYFPLGGSRCRKWKTIRNIFSVWSVSGLWHGANWTFVCWGLFHAMLLSISHWLGIGGKCKTAMDYKQILPKPLELLQMVGTFFFVVMGWIIFRAETMGQAGAYLTSMFKNKFFDASILPGLDSLCFGLLLLAVEWVQRHKQHALEFANTGLFSLRPVRLGVYYLLLFLIVATRTESQTFIYFQF